MCKFFRRGSKKRSLDPETTKRLTEAAMEEILALRAELGLDEDEDLEGDEEDDDDDDEDGENLEDDDASGADVEVDVDADMDGGEPERELSCGKQIDGGKPKSPGSGEETQTTEVDDITIKITDIDRADCEDVDEHFEINRIVTDGDAASEHANEAPPTIYEESPPRDDVI